MQIKAPKNSTFPVKRVGRGESSGMGRCAGRGNKGQHSRTGTKTYRGHEGGNLPLYRKLAKGRGYNQYDLNRPDCQVLTLALLEKAFNTGDAVEIEVLKQRKIVPGKTQRVKILSKGSLTKALHLKGIFASEAAQKSIETCGGTVQAQINA